MSKLNNKIKNYSINIRDAATTYLTSLDYKTIKTMRIINGKRALNLKRVTGTLFVPPMTVTDNLIADSSLLSMIMISFSPEDVMIFMDSSIELQLFTNLSLGPKTSLKDKFLCTDLDDGIAKIITPLKEAQAKKDAEELAAKKEAEEMASYKEKYELVFKELDGALAANKDMNNLISERSAKIDELTKEIKENGNTISELRNALKTATDKIDSMRNEFNAACQKFAISKTADGEWVMDLNKVEEYVELKELKDDFVSQLNHKSDDYDKLKSELDNYKKSWNELHDDVMGLVDNFITSIGVYQPGVELDTPVEVINSTNDLIKSLRSELDAQDKQLVRLHTIIGKASSKFNATLDGDEWKDLSTTISASTNSTSESSNDTPAEDAEKDETTESK